MKGICALVIFSLFIATFATSLELEHTPEGNLQIEKRGQFCFVECTKVSGYKASDSFTFPRINIPLSSRMFNDACHGIGKSCPCKQGRKFFRGFIGEHEYTTLVKRIRAECKMRLNKRSVKPVGKATTENKRECKDGVCCRQTLKCVDGKCQVDGIKCDPPGADAQKGKKSDNKAEKSSKGRKGSKSHKSGKLTRICITVDGSKKLGGIFGAKTKKNKRKSTKVKKNKRGLKFRPVKGEKKTKSRKTKKASK